MTIAKDFASKFAVAFVATAMLFALVAPAVNAAETTEDLQTTINDLLAQVAALQSQLGDDDADTTSASCASIPAPLTVGSQGANVTALQNRLIADGQAIAAGATGYFGAQTQAAVAGWQTAHNVAPAAGYYGPLTMAAMDAACVPADEDDSDDDSDDEGSDELSGEGTLDTFEIDNASDTDVQEGSEDSEIAEITLEADDGDVEVSRMDLKLYSDGDNTENDPWDVFETISLWVDGDMVAEFDASDEDEYLDEDLGTFRLTDLGLVLMEGEEVDVVLAATVLGTVDDAGVTDEDDWSIRVDEVRYFDADGVADDDSITGEIGDAATFNVVEAGDGEELKFSLGDNNPDSTDIIVDEDDTTDGVTILEYTIEAEEGDIELNNLAVNVDVTGDSYADVIDDIMLIVDGEEFDAEGTPADVNGSTTAQFDIDGDVTVAMDEEITVEVVVDFKSQATYANGTTIVAQVTSIERALTDAEGADDLGSADFSGSAVGETHTLVASGIVVPVDGFTSSVDTLGQDDTIGEYTLEFEVTAVEGDFYITDNAAAASTSPTDGVAFSVSPAAVGTITAVLDSTGDEDTTGVFTVSEGETETFTLTVTYDPAAAGSFRVSLDEVIYSASTNGTTSPVTYTPVPAQDFRSASQAINQ
ncbi:MAG: peptidoglycan-binding protein [Patescibacteria group bacterium]